MARKKQEGQVIDRASLFAEIGRTGLERYGGTVREEFLTELQGDKGRKLYREIRENHPVVNAIFAAIELALRKVQWYFESDDEADEEIAEFLNGCLDDMSWSWGETLAMITTMLEYGFSIFELVYKMRREGHYADGRIGWRKWLPISQDTLQPGQEWVFDNAGGIQAVNQKGVFPDYRMVTIPIEKCLLFRTTVAKNNPEGRSILRGAYVPWYYGKNLQEIEGIAAERMGTGVPVVYLGKDTTKAGANSDLELAKKIVRDLRMDEQMGVVIPYPKLGTDAEGKGMLFELVASPGRGMVDFDNSINRYNKMIALSCLAQFIMLGMENVGSLALSKEQGDIFNLALGAWAESICQVITRHGVPRLLSLNALQPIGLIKMAHSEVGTPDLQGIAAFVNTLVNARVLTPDENLEHTLRAMASLPEKQEQEQQAVEIVEVPAEREETKPEEESQGRAAEAFQARRAYGGARFETATNEYQKELESLYVEWYEDLSPRLEHEKDDSKREEILLAALLLLETQLKGLGRRRLQGAMELGAGGQALSPRGLAALANTIEENEAFIGNSLMPAIRERGRAAVRDAAFMVGGATAVAGLFASFLGRVASYAGEFWASIWRGMGDRVGEDVDLSLLRIERVLDPNAQHCKTCPPKAGVYTNWDAIDAAHAIPVVHPDDCFANCRCVLRIETAPGSGVFERMSEQWRERDAL